MLTVKIGGKQRPFKFGFNAIDEFCKLKNIGINEVGEKMANAANGNASLGDLRDIIYSGLAGAARSQDITIDFTNYQVGDWLDDMKREDIAKLMEAVGSALATSKKKEKVIGRKP